VLVADPFDEHDRTREARTAGGRLSYLVAEAAQTVDSWARGNSPKIRGMTCQETPSSYYAASSSGRPKRGNSSGVRNAVTSAIRRPRKVRTSSAIGR
jgi:hypothetical protein